VRKGLFTQPLQAAASKTSADASSITDAQIDSILSTALGLWQQAGISSSTIDPWRKDRVVIADLPGDLLGVSILDKIMIDRDAAGWGWFIDPTPDQSEEFVSNKGTTDASRSRVDLLSVVLHELGHAFGWSDQANEGGVMGERLAPGVRRFVTADAVDIALSRSR
jgi:hypothetical protein